MEIGPRLLVALLRLLQHLPMPALVVVGRGVGALLHRFGHRRRRIALRNLELCFPHQSPAERAAVVREHFALLGRSLVERALLWYAPVERLRGLVHVEGDVHLAERSPRPVMWLVPHFVGLEVAGAATQLFQQKTGCDIYTAQSNAVIDAAMHKGRARFGKALLFDRQQGVKPVVRAIKQGVPGGGDDANYEFIYFQF